MMLYKIASNIGKEITLQKTLPLKKTARCPVQYVCKIEDAPVLVVIAQTDIQKFYLKRSIEKQEEFAAEYSEHFLLNMPVCKGESDNICFAVYPYFEKAKWTKDESPLKKLSLLYRSYAKNYLVSGDLIAAIERDFLSAWPESFHTRIKNLDVYQKYFSLMGCQKELTIYKEHGDYTANNILNVDGKRYLVDFEFAKSFQPVWLDYYDYCRTTGRKYDDAWLEDNRIKGVWMDEMNDILDADFREHLTLFQRK